jgi:heme-degrading monooxygenase HmoA
VADTLLSYLKFVLASETDRDAFEEDLKQMLERAVTQPGYKWAEMGRDIWDDRKHIVLSEWETFEDMKAWENNTEHGKVMDRWPDEKYAEPFRHRRFVPWKKPEA